MLMSHWTYIKNVSCRAFRFWSTADSAAGFVRQLLAVLILFGGAFGINTENLLPKIPPSTIWLAAASIWMFFLFGYFAPKSLWEESQVSLIEQQTRFKRKLKLQFIPDTEGMHWATTLAGNKVLYVRAVVSTATEAHVRRVRPRLQLVEKIADGKVVQRIKNESLDLCWANLPNDQPLDSTIHHGDPRYFDIFRVINTEMGLALEFLTRPTKPDLILAAPGTYRFTVAVTAEGTGSDNIPVEKLTLEVDWDGETVRPRIVPSILEP